MFACGFAPNGFYPANGGILPIQRNTALFALYGVTYGGNGVSTFQLPDLGGNLPMHPGQGNGLSLRELGEYGGSPTVTLNSSQLAMHSHNPAALPGAKVATPAGSVWSNPGNERPVPNFFASKMVNPQALNASLIGSIGGNLPHNNLMPYVAITFGICSTGEFPPHG